jgi:hypothetical protein
VRILAASPAGVGATGLRGEMGRARCERAGEMAVRTGERGIEREFAEFAERGERTCEGWSLSREVVRVGTIGPRTRFLGFSISSFSLSTEMSSLLQLAKAVEWGWGAYLNRFWPRWGDGLARLCSSWIRFLAGDLGFSTIDSPAVDVDAPWLCFKSSSPIFTFRIAMGMRWTRISIRDRKTWA